MLKFSIKPTTKTGPIDRALERFYIWLRTRLLSRFVSPKPITKLTNAASREVDEVAETEDFRQRLRGWDRARVAPPQGGR